MVSKNSAIDVIPVPVVNGGTGLATLTAHALYVGNGTSAPTALAVGTTGQALVAATNADPAFGTLPVAGGGTGATSLTGLLVGNGASAVTTTTFTTATSFTPAFALSTPGDSAWTYTVQLGRYTQLGSMVFFIAELVWTNFTNATGSGTWLLNLPVTAGAFTRAGSIQISGSGIDASAETANLPVNFTGEIGSGATTVTLSVEEGGIGNAANALFNLTLAQVKTAGTMTVTGWYFAS